eukprot:SAG22_NODE_12793_length_429_cov_0.778788_1_plen_89_part_10
MVAMIGQRAAAKRAKETFYIGAICCPPRGTASAQPAPHAREHPAVVQDLGRTRGCHRPWLQQVSVLPVLAAIVGLAGRGCARGGAGAGG